MKMTNGLGSTMLTRRSVIAASAVTGLGLLAGCSSSSDSGSTSTTDTTEESGKLSSPTDFELDLETGEFTFNSVDENVGYYSLRVFKVIDGAESGDTLASSERINGGFTGEASGTVDLSGVKWGSYVANLVGYAPSGTDYETSDPAQIYFNAGVGGVLERPELLTRASGNEVDLIIDWYTLSHWYYYQLLPPVKVTFYSDADLTTVAYEETMDITGLTANLEGGDAMLGWGAYFSTEEEGGHLMEEGVYILFNNNLFTYSFDAGTYYLTLQGISEYDFIESSQVSEAVEVVLTDDEVTAFKTENASSLWAEPFNGGASIFGPATNNTDRVDSAVEQEVTMEIVES